MLTPTAEPFHPGRGYFHVWEVGELGPDIKFGGKIWGKAQQSLPNKRKYLGSSVTTRRKSWERIPILGSYLKFIGQNLGTSHLYFWRQNLGLRHKFQRQILGPSPRPPDMEVLPMGVSLCSAWRSSQFRSKHFGVNIGSIGSCPNSKF